jgi:hypothetical protein
MQEEVRKPTHKNYVFARLVEGHSDGHPSVGTGTADYHGRQFEARGQVLAEAEPPQKSKFKKG